MFQDACSRLGFENLHSHTVLTWCVDSKMALKTCECPSPTNKMNHRNLCYRVYHRASTYLLNHSEREKKVLVGALKDFHRLILLQSNYEELSSICRHDLSSQELVGVMRYTSCDEYSQIMLIWFEPNAKISGSTLIIELGVFCFAVFFCG